MQQTGWTLFGVPSSFILAATHKGFCYNRNGNESSELERFMNNGDLIGKVHSSVYHQCQARGYATSVDVQLINKAREKTSSKSAFTEDTESSTSSVKAWENLHFLLKNSFSEPRKNVVSANCVFRMALSIVCTPSSCCRRAFFCITDVSRRHSGGSLPVQYTAVSDCAARCLRGRFPVACETVSWYNYPAG